MSSTAVSWHLVNRFGVAVDDGSAFPHGAADNPPAKGDIVRFPGDPSYYKVVRRMWPIPLPNLVPQEPRQVVSLHIRRLSR